MKESESYGDLQNLFKVFKLAKLPGRFLPVELDSAYVFTEGSKSYLEIEVAKESEIGLFEKISLLYEGSKVEDKEIGVWSIDFIRILSPGVYHPPVSVFYSPKGLRFKRFSTDIVTVEVVR